MVSGFQGENTLNRPRYIIKQIEIHNARMKRVDQLSRFIIWDALMKLCTKFVVTIIFIRGQ